MEEIKQLFQEPEIRKIENLLKEVIQKIETADKEEQEKLIKEVIKNAEKARTKLEEIYTLMESIRFFPEEIAPLALLAEEITNDIHNHENVLKVLKFNLNNYFGQFKEPQEDDWHMEIKDFQKVVSALTIECNFFKVLQKKGIHLSIMVFPARFRKTKMEVLNYNTVNNTNFAIHSYYCKTNQKDKEEILEIALEQFGFLLKEIIVGELQKAPDNFMDLFDGIDMPKVDEESKELTALFANAFAHYIIEKMEMRVAEKFGEDKIQHLETRDDSFASKIVSYFDKLLENLLEEEEEWGDNEKCPCGSGKTYKKCCKKKKLKYYKGKDGKSYKRVVPIHLELKPVLEEEKLRFKSIFGRMPGDKDYIHGGVLLKDYKRAYKIIKRNGEIDKAWLYASDKTGLMLTDEGFNTRKRCKGIYEICKRI